MNRSILIVMCDFLVSAMLSMLIGMSPHGQSGHMGKGALLDRGSTAIILDELRRRGAELENVREQLREAQAREGFSEAREAQLKALAEQLAETLAKSELLEDKLKLHPENAGALTPQALQQKLEEEIRKRTLAGVQRKEAEAELERMRNSLQSVSGNRATLNTNSAVSQQQLADAKQKLADGWADYYSGKAEAEQKIADAEAELADAKQQLTDGKQDIASRDTCTVGRSAFKYVSHDAIASGTLDANIETRFYIDIGIVHGNAERRKQLCQRNFNCSVNVFPEELL